MKNTEKKENITENGSPQKKDNKRAKKIIIIVFAVLVVFSAVYMVVLQDIDVSVLADNIVGFFAKDEEDEDYIQYIFDEPNYKINIFEDRSYMALDRNVRYSKGGVTYEITDENYAKYGKDVELFGEYFACVISGDADGYNALFSKKYYSDWDNEPLERFTMQKVYDILITKDEQTTSADGVTTYYYIVEYKIKDNNGTLRTDMPSDASRPLAFVLTDREGSIKIDRIVGLNHEDL